MYINKPSTKPSTAAKPTATMSSSAKYGFSIKPQTIELTARSRGDVKKENVPGFELVERDLFHKWSTDLSDEARAIRFGLALKQSLSVFQQAAIEKCMPFYKNIKSQNLLVKGGLGFNIKTEIITDGAVGDNIVPLGLLVFGATLLPKMPQVTYDYAVVKWVDTMDKIVGEFTVRPEAKKHAGELTDILNEAVKVENGDIFVNIRSINFICNESSVTLGSGKSALQQIRIKRVRAVVGLFDKYLQEVVSKAEMFFDNLEALAIVEAKQDMASERKVDNFSSLVLYTSSEDEELQLSVSSSSGEEEEEVPVDRPVSARSRVPHPPVTPKHDVISTPRDSESAAGYIPEDAARESGGQASPRDLSA